MSDIRIHVTDRQSFKYCRRYYYFNVVLQLESKHYRPDYFTFGSAGHQVLASAYKQPESYDKFCLDAYKSLAEDFKHRELFLKVIRYYQPNILSDLEIYEVVDSEVEVKIEVKPGVWLVGTIDLILKHKLTGRIYGMDHKFYSTMPDPKSLELDDQMTAYYWFLVQQYGYSKVGGMIFNVIRKSVPAPPNKTFRDTKLSKDKTQDTTYDLYIAAIEEMKLNPEDYAEMLNYLRENESVYWMRVPIARGRVELNNWWDDIQHEFEDMTRDTIRYYPNPGKDCLDCQFFSPCKLMNEGADTRAVLDSNFKQKTEHI